MFARVLVIQMPRTVGKADQSRITVTIDMSEAAKAFISGVIATGVVISALALSHWDSQDWVRFTVFLILCAGAALLKGRIPGLTGTYSPLFFFILLGARTLSFSELVVVAGLAAIVQCTFNLRQYPCLSQIEFNAANTIISTALAYAFINRQVPGLTDQPLVILLILGASAYYLVNTGLVSIVLALVESKPLAPVWRRWCLASLLFYIAGALIAGAAVSTLRQITPSAAVLICRSILLLTIYYRYCLKTSLRIGRTP
jgi:hypothetical protein